MKKENLPGVTEVKLKKGITTDIDGVIPSMLNRRFAILYVGLETKSVTVTGTTLNVTLTEVEKRYKMLL
jgi:iron complex outermembrane receptor protein